MSRPPRPSSESAEGDVRGSPRASDFRALHRGGGLLTEAVDQRLGALLSVVAWRLGLPPTALTVANLVIGIATSTGVALVAGPVHRGTVAGWIVGLAALALWHVAYSLDCADGQLARLTGSSTAAGARADILADVAVHISLVAALAATASEQRDALPAWLVAVVAGTWMVNIVTSVLQSGSLAASLMPSTSHGVRLVKVVRDQAFVITVCAASIGFRPSSTPWVMVFFACVNGFYLTASIVAASRQSLRASPDGTHVGG